MNRLLRLLSIATTIALLCACGGGAARHDLAAATRGAVVIAGASSDSREALRARLEAFAGGQPATVVEGPLCGDGPELGRALAVAPAVLLEGDAATLATCLGEANGAALRETSAHGISFGAAGEAATTLGGVVVPVVSSAEAIAGIEGEPVAGIAVCPELAFDVDASDSGNLGRLVMTMARAKLKLGVAPDADALASLDLSRQRLMAAGAGHVWIVDLTDAKVDLRKGSVENARVTMLGDGDMYALDKRMLIFANGKVQHATVGIRGVPPEGDAWAPGAISRLIHAMARSDVGIAFTGISEDAGRRWEVSLTRDKATLLFRDRGTEPTDADAAFTVWGARLDIKPTQ